MTKRMFVGGEHRYTRTHVCALFGRKLSEGHYETATATLTKTPLYYIKPHFQNYFLIISTSSICIMWPDYSGAESVKKAVKLR